MSAYFDTLADAANGARQAAMPLPSPIFAREEDVELLEPETQFEDAPRRYAETLDLQTPQDVLPKASHLASLVTEPATNAQQPVRPASPVSAPTPHDVDPVRLSVLREEHVIQTSEQRTIQVKEQVVERVQASPSLPEIASGLQSIGDRPGFQAGSVLEQSVLQVVEVREPVANAAVSSPEITDPEIIIALPLAEAFAMPMVTEVPQAGQALSIEIAHIDIHILPPATATSPAPVQAPISPALSLTDYLADRSGFRS